MTHDPNLPPPAPLENRLFENDPWQAEHERYLARRQDLASLTVTGIVMLCAAAGTLLALVILWPFSGGL